MKKIILFIALMTMTLSFAQSKQVNKLLDSSEDGVSTVYNDSKQAVSTVYNDVKSLSPKVESAIKSLATELKTTTNALWEILVKQQLVWSLCFLTLTISSLINWYMFCKRMYSKPSEIEWTVLERDIIGKVINPNYNKYRDGDTPMVNGSVGKEQYNAPKITEQSTNNVLFHWIHFGICVILSYFSFIHFSDMLTGFINPEFSAITTIIDVAKGLK